MNKRFHNLALAFAFGWVALSTGICWGQSPQVSLTDTTSLIFTSVKEGQELIGERDDYINRLGELEIQLRLESKEPVSIEAFLKGMQASVIEWKPEEIRLLTEATNSLRDIMKAYQLDFPEKVHLIRVSTEGGLAAPHCRMASIILTDSFFENSDKVKEVLAHELFHVLSSHNLELRDRLYRIINFEPSNEISLPKALKARRLTNPDAPTNKHVVYLSVANENVPVVPVLVAKSSEFRPGGLFANLDFKLMVLEKKDGTFAPKLSNGQPKLLAPNEAPDYLQKIGRNTGYIIHPEETLADNFSMMLLGSNRIRDAWVIDEMKKVLQK